MNADRLRQLLDYDPAIGHFTWKINGKGGGQVAGKRAGSIDKQAGYEQVGIDGKLYRSHRLAWLYVHGEWPSGQIDHINGIRSDNRLANLRAVSNQVNGQNRHAANKNNGRKLLGVYRDKDGGRTSQ